MNTFASLSRREVDALVLLARFRFLSRWQLQRFLFAEGNDSSVSKRILTTRVLNALVTKRLVDRTNRNVGGPSGGSVAYAYHPTAHGIRSLDDKRFRHLPRRLPPRGTFLLRHALATADVALAFRRAAANHRDHSLAAFECDWEAAIRVNPRLLVVPDARLVYRTRLVELTAFIEIDLGTAGSKFFARKIANYLTLLRSNAWRGLCDVWPTVLVVTPTEERAEFLARTTESLLSVQSDAEQLQRVTEFSFAPLAAVVADPLAPVWRVAGKAEKQPIFTRGPL